MSEAELAQESTTEHQVTPLELFFDLAFVFAITQVTSLLARDPTWHGVLRGMLVLVALWWAWTGYAWLTSTMDVDEGGVRLAVLTSMGAMLVAALAVPHAFGDHGVLFGVAYLLVRVLHVVLYAIVGRDDPDLLGAVLRFAPTAIAGASLLVLACDQPWVPADLLRTLAATDADVALCAVEGRPQPLPARCAPALLPQLRAALAREAPLREALTGLAPVMVAAEARWLAGVNTPEELAAAERALA